MKNPYSEEELELITLLEKRDRNALDKIADIIAKKVGDMEFNAKLLSDNTPALAAADPDNPTAEEQQAIDQFENSQGVKSFLAYFTFKTRDLDQFEAVAQKLQIAQKLEAQQLPISEDEKLTLSEYNKIFNLQSLDKKYGERLKMVAEGSQNHQFLEVYNSIKKSTDIASTIGSMALEAKNYKDGDLALYLSSKTKAVQGRQTWSGHEGKLEEAFITKYNHAAPIYIDRRNPAEPIVTKSDIWKEQRSDALNLEEILKADVLRIDPAKLVDEQRAEQLKNIDYGYKQDPSGAFITDEHGQKVKNTWQDVMQFRYEELSHALHVGQIPYQIEEHEIQLEKIRKELKGTLTQSKALGSKIKILKKKKQAAQNALRTQSEYLNKALGASDLNSLATNHKKSSKEILRKYPKLKQRLASYAELNLNIDLLNKEILEREKAIKLLDTQTKELKQEKTKINDLIQEKTDLILTNDKQRLDGRYWLNPKTILKGHKQSLENDFRDLSQRMFQATTKEREMICSEFAARSIISVTDQLNKLTSLDLQAQGIIANEERIIKEPISKKENLSNIHPERLAKILEQSGCVTKVVNPGLKNLIQLENTAKTKIEAKDYQATLPKKLYAVLKNSTSQEEFQEKGAQVTQIYLEAYKVEPDVIEKSKETFAEQLQDVYQQYIKQPDEKGILNKIKGACIKVLEFCGLYTKDKNVKKNLGDLIKDIGKGIEPEVPAKESFAQVIINERERSAAVIGHSPEKYKSASSNKTFVDKLAEKGIVKNSGSSFLDKLKEQGALKNHGESFAKKAESEKESSNNTLNINAK